MQLIGKIEVLHDINNNPYLGLNVSNLTVIFGFVDMLKRHLIKERGEIVANRIIENQIKRDKGGYHITLFNVAETTKELIAKYNGLDVIFDLGNIGSIEQLIKSMNTLNSTYFIIVKSFDLDKIRKESGFQPKDFHITLGFLIKDIFGLPKNDSTTIIEFN